jgi:hypothetical protein
MLTALQPKIVANCFSNIVISFTKETICAWGNIAYRLPYYYLLIYLTLMQMLCQTKVSYLSNCFNWFFIKF